MSTNHPRETPRSSLTFVDVCERSADSLRTGGGSSHDPVRHPRLLLCAGIRGDPERVVAIESRSQQSPNRKEEQS